MKNFDFQLNKKQFFFQHCQFFSMLSSCQKHLVLLWQQNEDMCLAAYAVAHVDGIQIASSLKVILGQAGYFNFAEGRGGMKEREKRDSGPSGNTQSHISDQAPGGVTLPSVCPLSFCTATVHAHEPSQPGAPSSLSSFPTPLQNGLHDAHRVPSA